MSSNEDMFALSDNDADMSPSCEFEMSESPTPATPNTPASFTPVTPTPPNATPTPPLPVSNVLSEVNLSDNQDSFLKDCSIGVSECVSIRIDFMDEDGKKVSQSRYTDNSEIIKIVKSLIVSDCDNSKFRNAAAASIAGSELLKSSIQQQVLRNISQEFSEFLNSDECPLKDMSLFQKLTNLEEFDFELVLEKCMNLAPSLVKTLGTVCFGAGNVMKENSKYRKQRLLTIIGIAAFTRNQSYNVIQKILGEFLKLKSCNRMVLQLLQRMGLSLVSMAIRSDMDVISRHFMHEVLTRKVEIEEWALQRKMLEKEVKSEILKSSTTSAGILSVKFTQSELIPSIVDIGELEFASEDVVTSPHVKEMIKNNFDSPKAALEKHLDDFPAPFTVSYDNLDIGVAPNEYISGSSKDQSLHWCSSVVSEDVVLGNELTDENPERPDNLDFNYLVKLTKDERNHLLANYSKLVVNIIVTNWPKSFPELKIEKVTHQYTEQFEAGVKSFTGPLVCETESSIEGISCVIRTIVDIVCPSEVNDNGVKVPIYPTTFR